MTLGPRPNGANASVAPAAEPALVVSPDEAETPTDAGAKTRLKKAPSAFRTISEVADDLHIPQHVLRFWETKFPQVRPLKRGGGRRYYRPDDIALLRRISGLLYIQGFTIKGVQRLLRESGGRLSDDIPPPSGDERQDPAGASGDPELPLPALASLVPGARVAQPLSISGSGDWGGGPARLDGGSAEDDQAAYEVVRLRRLLTEALVELQALRALLP